MRWWDVESVVPLEQALFPSDPWSPEGFWSELAQVDTRYYVVSEEGGDVVGYAGLMAVGSEADVQTIAVAPSRQGSGLGRHLLEELVQEARRRGCAHVLLEVRADNVAARRLYESSGFERVALRRGYYQPEGADALVMRRRISGHVSTEPGR